MTNLPTEMEALILSNDGYAAAPSGSVLEAMEPYVEHVAIGVPAPGSGQGLVKVARGSINPSDGMFLQGLSGQPRGKGRPAGFEGVGVVVAAGAEPAAQALLGRRIAFTTGLSNWGSWAEYAITEADSAIPLLDSVSDADGAAMIVNPMTALAMFDIVRTEGEKAFVLTAGASQLCKLIMGVAKEEGFRPIAIVRRDDQIPLLLAAGAAHVLNAESPDFAKALREVMKAERPRIFLDAVTGPLASAIFEAMPRRARWIVYGRLDPDTTAIREPGQLIFQQKKIEGFWLRDWFLQHPERTTAAVIDAQTRFSDGRWKTDVTAIVPIAEAMRRVPEELAKPNGKVFIAP